MKVVDTCMLYIYHSILCADEDRVCSSSFVFKNQC
uniref:Uncharacterized protein MANES_08G174400 n=1 Tax=Rhizophora mucronata TaxID=61149 RepID=A0A2P2MA81_RHIMU